MNTIHCPADCTLVLPNFPSGSIQLILTSPPYKEEDGYSVDLLRFFARQAFSLLAEGCFCVVNIGPMPTKQDISSRCSVLLEDAGLQFMFKIIWKKTFKRGGGIGITFQYPRPYNYYPNIMTEDILVYKKPGKRERRKEGEYSRDLVMRCRTDVWELYTSPLENAFPMKLADAAIQFWSYPGDKVLDPFAGHGTVGRACTALGRNAILIERNPALLGELKRVGRVVKH